MQRQIPPGRLFSCTIPTHLLPQEVGNRPEHARCRGPAPRVRTIAHFEMSDERRGESDGEAGVGPFFEPRWDWRKYHDDSEELGPREFHLKVRRKAEVSERLCHLREPQLRIRGEADLQAEKGG